MIAKHDTKKDGKLDFEEFKAIFFGNEKDKTDDSYDV